MFIYKTLLVAFIFSLPFAAFSKDTAIDDSKLKVYTIKEFITHNTQESCWTLMDDKYIYDVTKYLPSHPAPLPILLKCCGKDCTKQYKDKGMGKPHSEGADAMKRQMLIGILKK